MHLATLYLQTQAVFVICKYLCKRCLQVTDRALSVRLYEEIIREL